MSAGTRTAIRIPLLLLAIGDLALLALRVRPLSEILSLPGHGAAGIDPAVCLVGYLGLVFWLTGSTGSRLVTAQSAVTWLGVAAGAVLAARFWLSGVAPGPATSEIQGALLAAAGILWGMAGARATRDAGTTAVSLIAGIWSAMVSSLIACAVVLGQFYISGPPPETQDAYKQFQEIGLGDPATVVLLHALSAATGLLLVGPLSGGGLALIFGYFGRKRTA